ncbi:MAG TPA: DUF222 domain-containing protein, partial [Pilimelia sp.]|nr:DUF222 domain-containing protein [Pilimelia sp.]
MSSSGVAGAVTGPVGGLLASLDELAGQEPAVVASAALRADLLALLAATNRLHAELARRVAAADASGSCTADGFRSVGAWLRAFGRLSIASSARLVRAARVLRQLPALATAAGRGDVSAEHIRRVDLLVERVGVDV